MTHGLDPEKLQRMFEMLVSLFLGAGVPKEAALVALEQAYASHEAAAALESEADPMTRADKLLMGNLLSLWANLPDYCDDEGHSLAIPIHGSLPSLEDLLARAITRTPEVQETPDLATTVQRLLDRNTIAPDSNGRYLRLLDYFPVNASQRANAAMLLDYLDDYLYTTEYNTRHGGGTGHFQRVAQASGFPVSQLPVVNRLTHEAGMEFLRTVDAAIMDFIEDASDQDAAAKTDVGVGVYMYARHSDT